MSTDAAPLPEGGFDGPSAFRAALQQALAAAAGHHSRELVLSDRDFADWPLGDRATVEALQAWSASGRSFVLLAQRFKVFEAHHARFVQWRQMWSHIVDCRVCSGSGAPEVPSAIWTPAWFLHRIDPDRSRGVVGTDPASRRALREQLDECLRHGRPGFPASTLGL